MERKFKNWLENSVNNLNLFLGEFKELKRETRIQEFSASARYDLKSISVGGSGFQHFLDQTQKELKSFQSKMNEKIEELSKEFKSISSFGFRGGSIIIEGIKTKIIEIPNIDKFSEEDFKIPIAFYYGTYYCDRVEGKRKQNNIESDIYADCALIGGSHEELMISFKGISQHGIDIILNLKNLKGNKGVFIRKLLQKHNFYELLCFIKLQGSLINITVKERG